MILEIFISHITELHTLNDFREDQRGNFLKISTDFRSGNQSRDRLNMTLSILYNIISHCLFVLFKFNILSYLH